MRAKGSRDRRHPTRPGRGFTLIEVLVAFVIVATISVSLWQSLSLSFRMQRRVGEINDRYHEGRQIMMRIARELRMAFLRTDVPSMGLEEEPTFLTQFKGEDEEIHFATTAHLRLHAEARESDQTEIAYFLKRGEDRRYRGKTLFRRESKRIDSQPDRGGTIWPAVEGVKEFKLEYWDDAKEIGDDAWGRSWDTEGENEDLLPARVRVTLVLESADGRPPIRFVTQAAPRIRRPVAAVDELQKMRNQGQIPGGKPR